MSLTISAFPVTAFQQNCSLIISEETNMALAIDPGGDIEKLEMELEENGAQLKEIWLTHGHLDHAGAARQFADRQNVKVVGPQIQDDFWLKRLELQAQQYGLPSYPTFQPDQWLEGDAELNFEGYFFKVIHCPGHTPGHVVFYQKELGWLIAGDVLFNGSIGRTDFPMSNHQDLVDSIQKKLFILPGETVVYPGHGPTTTIEKESKDNPFVGAYS
jgi:glyoxylase-like metal-dependent hydrolase (beta-lactamase superfamily II)